MEYMGNYVAERDRRLVQRKKKRGLLAFICPVLLCFGIEKD